MTIDITKCNKINIIDSCSIWNLLSSLILYKAVQDNHFFFSFTKYVEYECLYKPRASNTDDKIKARFIEQIKECKFSCYGITIDDLQDPDIKKYRKRLGIGELSSIAFCKKTDQIFLTDDQNARKIAKNILGHNKVQTIPHILGWLFYSRHLGDGDLEPIIREHISFGRPLEKYFREVHLEALRIRCLYTNKAT